MVPDWKEDPSPLHQRIYDQLLHTGFYSYEPNTDDGLKILRRNVGYALFGPPDEEPESSNVDTGYSAKRYEAIDTVASCLIEVNEEKTLENRDQLDMAVVFVFVSPLLQYPVFRLRMSESDCCFVDSNRRVYSTWRNFLETNELPPGKCCWPLDGVYCGDEEDNVKVEWGVTPAATPERQMLQTVDKVSSWTSLGTAGVFLTAMAAPLVAPVAAAAAAPVVGAAGVCAMATGVYSAARSGWALIDRRQHRQTVNPLRDRQAASSWLSVAGSATGLAAGVMVNRAATMATEGLVMSAAEQAAVNAISAAALAVNATGVGFGFLSVKERYEEGELTPLDVFQFASAVLFFTHSTVTFQTASSIIQDVQKGVLQDYQDSLRSNRHRRAYRKVARATVAGSDNAIDGNAKIIRSIRKIDNKDDFFAGLVRTRRDLRNHEVTFSENGNIIVNGGAEIHPMKLYSIGKQQRQEFLSLANQAANGAISEVTLTSGIQSAASSSTWTPSDSLLSGRGDSTLGLTALTSQLQNLFPRIVIGITEVKLAVMVVDELTSLICADSSSDLKRWWKLVWKHVVKLVDEMIRSYEETKRIAIEVGNFLDDDSFNLEQGIRVTNMFVHYVMNVYRRYSECISDLIRDIEEEQNRHSSHSFELS